MPQSLEHFESSFSKSSLTRGSLALQHEEDGSVDAASMIAEHVEQRLAGKLGNSTGEFLKAWSSINDVGNLGDVLRHQRPTETAKLVQSRIANQLFGWWFLALGLATALALALAKRALALAAALVELASVSAKLLGENPLLRHV